MSGGIRVRFQVIQTLNYRGKPRFEIEAYTLDLGLPILSTHPVPVLSMTGKPWRTRNEARAHAVCADLNRTMRIRAFLSRPSRDRNPRRTVL